MRQFEQDINPGRVDREEKSLWSKGIIYQNSTVNELFLVYRKGYAYGKAMGRIEG